jgi:hypothetical protein
MRMRRGATQKIGYLHSFLSLELNLQKLKPSGRTGCCKQAIPFDLQLPRRKMAGSCRQ